MLRASGILRSCQKVGAVVIDRRQYRVAYGYHGTGGSPCATSCRTLAGGGTRRAAAVHPCSDAVATSPATFMHCLKVNIGSVHLLAHFGVPALRARGGGAIVNVASVQGFSCQAGVAAYVASKGVIHALTRTMALDYARENIRVVSVSPASVRTPILALGARTFDGPDEEVADLVAFLASGRSGFITGSDPRIDGGLSVAIAALGQRCILDQKEPPGVGGGERLVRGRIHQVGRRDVEHGGALHGIGMIEHHAMQHPAAPVATRGPEPSTRVLIAAPAS